MTAKPTGPKSSVGKQRASQNATTHGITSQASITPDEKPRVAAAFRLALFESLAPIGMIELILADRIATLAWRLKRVERAEAGLYEHEMKDVYGTDGQALLGLAQVRASHKDVFSKISRYETAIERSLFARCMNLNACK
jgi:hypothetical protein